MDNLSGVGRLALLALCLIVVVTLLVNGIAKPPVHIAAASTSQEAQADLMQRIAELELQVEALSQRVELLEAAGGRLLPAASDTVSP